VGIILGPAPLSCWGRSGRHKVSTFVLTLPLVLPRPPPPSWAAVKAHDYFRESLVGQSIGSLYVHYEFAFYKEQPRGGIFNLTTQQLLYDRVVPIGSQMRFSDTLNLGTRRGGYDFGITLTNTGFQVKMVIPRRWQGVWLRITCLTRAEPAFASAPTFPVTAFSDENCVVDMGNWLGKFDSTSYGLWAYSQWSNQISNLVMFVKCYDVMNGDGVVNFPDPFTNYLTTSAITAGLMIEQINSVLGYPNQSL